MGPATRSVASRLALPGLATGLAFGLEFGLVACAPSADGADGEAADEVCVWVEVDTLRADALGCYGNTVRGEGGAEPSPNIDALARDGIRFERAYATAPWTVPSLVSQLTGRWPWEHGALRVMEPVGDVGETVAERFAAHGFRTAGVMTNFIVRADLGFARGFERWDESFGASAHEGSTGAAAVARLLELSDELAAEARERDEPLRVFLFALLFEPHYRYEDRPGPRFGPGYSGGPAYEGPLTGGEELVDLRARRASLSRDDVAFLRGRYQSEVARVDRAVGALVAGLQERGLWDDALFVLVADHGEEIMDRSWIGHTRTLYDELVRVPLVLRVPGAEPGVVTSPVSLVDLGATVLDLAGVGADPSLGEGRSLRALALEGGAPPRRYLYLHSDFEPPLRTDETTEKRTRLWGVVDGERDLKWIVDRHPEREPSGALFDLDADPGETRDVAGEREVPAELRRLPELEPGDGS